MTPRARLKKVETVATNKELKKELQSSVVLKSSWYQCHVKDSNGEGKPFELKEKTIKTKIGTYKNR
jgi:hypothetical protein